MEIDLGAFGPLAAAADVLANPCAHRYPSLSLSAITYATFVSTSSELRIANGTYEMVDSRIPPGRRAKITAKSGREPPRPIILLDNPELRWAAEVWPLGQPLEAWLIFWLYPFSTKVLAEVRDPDGSLLAATLLSPTTASTLFAARQSSPMFRYRQLLTGQDCKLPRGPNFEDEPDLFGESLHAALLLGKEIPGSASMAAPRRARALKEISQLVVKPFAEALQDSTRANDETRRELVDFCTGLRSESLSIGAHKGTLVRMVSGEFVDPFRLEIEFETDGAREEVAIITPRYFLDCHARTRGVATYIKHVLENFDLDRRRRRTMLQPRRKGKTIVATGDGVVGTRCIAFARKRGDSSPVLVPDLYYFEHNGYVDQALRSESDDLRWPNRRALAFWRGSTTGGRFDNSNFWDLPRIRLCAQTSADLVDAKITTVTQGISEEVQREVQQKLSERNLMATFAGPSEYMSHKYVIDIEGNTNSWGLISRFLFGSCILRVRGDWEQWFDEELKEWDHYVPVARDLNDLEEVVKFLIAHDEIAQRVAESGLSWARSKNFAAEMRNMVGKITDAMQII